MIVSAITDTKRYHNGSTFEVGKDIEKDIADKYIERKYAVVVEEEIKEVKATKKRATKKKETE